MESIDELLPATPREQRAAMALKIRQLDDVKLPRLEGWNLAPCFRHEKPDFYCQYRACGGELKAHQRVGVAFHYFAERAILADVTGLGKTNIIVGLATLLKQRGELTNRAVVMCQATAVGQWCQEMNRFSPGLHVIPATGPRNVRLQRYASNWDVCVIGFQMALRDQDVLSQLGPFALMVDDDVDAIKELGNQTAQAYNYLTSFADRVVNINATPLHTKLEDLYATSVSVGGLEIFGTRPQFERRYVRTEKILVSRKRGGGKAIRTEILGYKNMKEFREKIAPIYLRRTVDDLHDVTIPKILPPVDVWLEMTPRQKKAYQELQKGVLKLMTAEGADVKRAEAWTKVLYGAEVCSSMTNFGEPDSPQASAKMNWLMHQLATDWQDGTKIVVFSRFKGFVRAFSHRLTKEGIRPALIWGEQKGSSRSKMELRQKEVDRFWNDKDCQVIIGTMAIARSLNLQVANTVVNVDLLLNPAIMTQILGRIRRVGSPHSHVSVINLLMSNSQEEGYHSVLEQRQGLIDFINDEADVTDRLFAPLSPIELLQLIRP